MRTHCVGCNAEFTILNSAYQGFRRASRCKECLAIYNREYKRRKSLDPEWKAAQEARPSRTKEGRKKQYINWKYGLSIEEYNEKLNLQLNGCAICKQPCSTGRQLAIDHNHKTNIIRDLLCYRCNSVLGSINEDENILIEMIEYLKRHDLEKVS